MSILIKDILLDGKRTDIAVEGNRISSIGGHKDGSDIVLDGKGKAAIPGLINTHGHAAMTLLRGYADDMNLHEWLSNHIWPREAKMTSDDVYWGTKLACLEMIKSGTTAFNDMYWHLEGAAKAADESGMRGLMSGVFIDMFAPDKADSQRKDIKRQLKGIKTSGRVRIGLGPHAIYTVTEESLRWFKELSDEKGLIIHIHLSETKKEVDDCVSAHGKRPVEYLDSIGFLGPNVIAAHCVWLDKKEIALMAKNGVSVAHCPTSNMKLSVGAALDYASLKAAKVRVSLGTDGCSSNNNLDMFETMKFAALLAKMRSGNPTEMPAHEAFSLATEHAARAMQLDAGRIAEGALADIVLIDLKRPCLTPLHNLTSDLVYSAGGGCADTVICDGRILMEKGYVKGEEDIMEKAQEVAQELKVRK